MNKDDENLVKLVADLIQKKGVKVNPEYKKKWIEALRSGRYQKCKKLLSQSNQNNKKTYSILGVLCDVIIQQNPELHDKIIWESNYLPDDFAKLSWLMRRDVQLLMFILNDDVNQSFEEIAAFIDKNL